MSNQTAAVVAAIATSVNWERKGINLQAIIEAANQGKLGGPLTDWLVAQKWNDEVSTPTETTKLVESISGYLRLISGAESITLDPTDGNETIAQAKDLFTAGIDADFRNYGCDVASDPSGPTSVTVHEMVKDGDFRAIFGSLSEKLDTLCLKQTQIIQFVQKHRKWLRTEGYATFFLFKVGDEFFVARVYVNSVDRLLVHVLRFMHGHVWAAKSRFRVVVPQLAPMALANQAS